MADLSKYIDNSLEAEFNRKAADPSKNRKKLLDGITRTMDQLNSKTPVKAPNKWAVVSNGVARVTVRLGSTIVPIGGNETNYMPREQAVPFLTELSRVVDTGGLDQEITAALSGQGGQSSAGKVTRTRTYSPESLLNIRVGGFRRGGMPDDEIKAKLTAEGVDAASITKAISRKKA